MKLLAMAWLMTAPLWVLAQAESIPDTGTTDTASKAYPDSVRIKLEQGKHLYEDGLITRREYRNLRAAIMGLPQARPLTDEEMNVRSYYRNALVTGFVFCPIGFAMLIGGLRRENRIGDAPAHVLVGMGSAMTVGGLTLLVYSGKLKRRLKNLIMSTDGTSVTMAYRF